MVVVGWGCCLLAIMLRFPLLWAVLPTSFYLTYGKAFRDGVLKAPLLLSTEELPLCPATVIPPPL